jgi:hypothetical protein
MRGLNAGKVKDDSSDAMSIGFWQGFEPRQEAEGYRMASSINGGMRKSNKKHHEVDQMVDQSGTLTLNLNPSKEVPPTPLRGKSKPKVIGTIPEGLLDKLQTICKDWPRQSAYRDNQTGRFYKADVGLYAKPEHLWARFAKMFKGEDYHLMADCGLEYLDEIERREKVIDLYPNVCAMTNFYGEKELWKKMVAKVQK